MHRYNVAFSGLFALVLAADVTSAAAGSSFVANTVCMSLPVFIVSLLLPARDVADVAAAYLPGDERE